MIYTENELILQIKMQNTEAYDYLIKEYSKTIYYIVYKILNINGTKQDIEECVSDVLLDVWLKINDFDKSKASFRTWIFIIAKFKALQYKRSIEKVVSLNIDDYEIEDNHIVEKQIIDREEQKRIIKIIEKFNSIDKELFIRRYFYNEDIKNLMISLNLSRSAIDNRLLRGRKLIKEVYSNE